MYERRPGLIALSIKNMKKAGPQPRPAMHPTNAQDVMTSS
jgi:hypothetical protein